MSRAETKVQMHTAAYDSQNALPFRGLGGDIECSGASGTTVTVEDIALVDVAVVERAGRKRVEAMS